MHLRWVECLPYSTAQKQRATEVWCCVYNAVINGESVSYN